VASPRKGAKGAKGTNEETAEELLAEESKHGLIFYSPAKHSPATPEFNHGSAFTTKRTKITKNRIVIRHNRAFLRRFGRGMIVSGIIRKEFFLFL
jgi:hypothetical protein